MNRALGCCRRIRDKQASYDIAHPGKYEQGGTDTKPSGSEHRAHSLEEPHREQEEQEGQDDEIGDLNPAVRSQIQIADRITDGRVPWRECTVNREHEGKEDRSNDPRPQTQAQGRTLCSDNLIPSIHGDGNDEGSSRRWSSTFANHAS